MIKKILASFLITNCFLVNYSHSADNCIPHQKASGSILISAVNAKSVCAGCPDVRQPDLVLKGDIFTAENGNQYVVTKDVKSIDKRIPVQHSQNSIDTLGQIRIMAPDEYEPRPHYKPNLGFASDSEIFFYHDNDNRDQCVYGEVGTPNNALSSSNPTYYVFDYTRQDYYKSPCVMYNPVAYQMGSSMAQVPIEAIESGSKYNISSDDNIKLLPQKQYYALKNVGHVTYKRDIVGGTDDCTED